MNVYKSTGHARVPAILTALFLLAACGQQEQSSAASETEDSALPDRVPVTTVSDEARVLYGAGLVLADNLHFLEANEAFAKAVEIDPGFAMGYLRLAQSSQSATAFFRAVGLAEDNVKNGTEGEQLYIKALIAGAENDQDMQLEYLVSLMSMYPRDERTHMQLANYFTVQQNFSDVVKHYGHATAIDPEFAAAYNALGYAHCNHGNLADARQAFSRYVELIPGEANPYDSYAELLLLDEQTYLFKAAIAAMVDGDHETMTSRAAEYSAAAQVHGAAGERLRIHELSGYLAAVNGDLAASAAALKQANQLDPIVLYWSAVANSSIGNTDKAKDLASRAAYHNTLSPNLPFFEFKRYNYSKNSKNPKPTSSNIASVGV